MAIVDSPRKKDPTVSTESGMVRVLVVSALEEDYRTLRDILRGSKWSLYWAVDLSSALAQLRSGPPISLVVCECNLSQGTWKDLWASLSVISDAPLLVVASRCADEQLWAEVLNIGAYDVLSKPFETAEVVHSLNMGWLRRRSRDAPPAVCRAVSGF